MAGLPKKKPIKPVITTKKRGNCAEFPQGPRGMTQDQESELIYLADAVFHYVQVFTPTLDPMFHFGSKDTMSTPAGMCIVGNVLYLTNWGSNTLALYTLEGNEITQLRGASANCVNSFKQPIGTTYDQQNEALLVCDYGGDNVKKFNDFHTKFIDIPKPFDIKMTSEFVIVVTGELKCLYVYDMKGTLLQKMVTSNQGEDSDIGNPSFFGIDECKNIWLSDYRRDCICQIQEGKVIRRFGGTSGITKSKENLFSKPTGLLLDKRGNLISACVRKDNQIQVFDIRKYIC